MCFQKKFNVLHFYVCRSKLLVISVALPGLYQAYTRLIDCVQASEGERKREDERVKREKIGRGRIAVRDAYKDAIVFFNPPSN